MKKFYRKKDRVTAVKLWLTADQIAVLMNHALYRGAPSSLSVQAEAQFVFDWACSCMIEHADLLRQEGSKPLAFDASRLPDPQEEAAVRRARRKSR